MTAAFLPDDDVQTNTSNNHLEIFGLIWLDENINNKDITDTESKLRTIINHLKKFQNKEKCQQYIEGRSEQDRLVLIVSSGMGLEIVPSIHKLRQVTSIYVYGIAKQGHEQFTCKFSKVRSAVVEVEELISQIKADHKIQKKIDEPLSINTYTSSNSAGVSTTEVNAKFIFFQALIEHLLQLKPNETDRNELISLFKIEYEGNNIELNKLREFEQNYSSDKVLWWYTRESFFYRTLNRALRTQNIHMIFLFRTYIFDIYRQLQRQQAKNSLQVYRSQLISNDELNGLKLRIGQYISVNSFFSTSKKRSIALFYMDDATQPIDVERVLFEIDADPRMISTKPFAGISTYSNFPIELEVLFMLGSIFRLNSIHRNDGPIWIIRMSLCNDDELDFKPVLMYMKEQIRNEETNLRTLSRRLWKMGELDLAETYLDRLLKQLPPDDPSRSALYEDLGELASQKRDFDICIKWYQKLLAIKNKDQLIDNRDTRQASNSIGEFIEKQLC